MDDDSWITFWEESAENANEAIRLGNILPDKTISCDENKAFFPIFSYYLKNLVEMDEKMKANLTKARMTVYRNFYNDIYFEFEEGDDIPHKCFTSCFIDGFNSEKGDYKAKITVPKGTPYLQYQDTIILPPGTFRFVKQNGIQYKLEMTGPVALFQD